MSLGTIFRQSLERGRQGSPSRMHSRIKNAKIPHQFFEKNESHNSAGKACDIELGILHGRRVRFLEIELVYHPIQRTGDELDAI